MTQIKFNPEEMRQLLDFKEEFTDEEEMITKI